MNADKLCVRGDEGLEGFSRSGLTYRSIVEDFTRGFRRQDSGRVHARWLKEKRQEILSEHRLVLHRVNTF